VAVVLIVIVAGLFFVKADNYSPFIPPAKAVEGASGGATPLIQALFGYTPTNFGVMGIFTAAAVVFFAFIGFDVVATAAEETRNPQRDVPRGILGSLIVCTVLYMAVALVVTGMEKYTRLSDDAPLSDAFKAVGQHAFADIINVGAVAGLTSVTMILLLGQSRVFFAMSRDGLLPRTFSTVDPRFGTPSRAIVLLGAVVAVLAGLIPLEALSELVNIGTLFAFIVVSVGVVVLRRTRPDLHRSFRCPWVPVLPVLSVLASLWLMINLPVATWWRFLVWMVLGVVVYALYGRSHSRMGDPGRARTGTSGTG
jgi:APA family basic amino acid/polyamine antiporter